MHGLCVYMPLVIMPREGGHGIYNMHNNLSACCAHKKARQADESKQVLTQKNGASPLPCCDQESNPGHWVNSLVCQPVGHIAPSPHPCPPKHELFPSVPLLYVHRKAR